MIILGGTLCAIAVLGAIILDILDAERAAAAKRKLTSHGGGELQPTEGSKVPLERPRVQLVGNLIDLMSRVDP